MSNIKEIKPPGYKSVQSIMDFGRRMLKTLQNKDIRMCAYVLVGRDGRYHFDHSSGMSHDDKDKLLDALEELHEEIYADSV